MTVLFHPDFPNDIRRFTADYQEVSGGLATRFRQEVDQAIEAVKSSPQSAGHLLPLEFQRSFELRRRNLRVFPFFILYGSTPQSLIFASLIPSRSDPLTWLNRFG